MDVARSTYVETRRLRRVNVDDRPTRKMRALEKLDERPTRKMYALEVNKLLAEERRTSLSRARPHRSCEYEFVPLQRPGWMRQRRAPIVGVLAAAISALLAYLFLH